MPDLGPAASGLLQLLTPILGPALGAFLRTTIGMSLLGLSLTFFSFVWAGQGSFLRGVLAGALALALCTAIGTTLAAKRAIGRGLLHGLQHLRLGHRLLDLIFERLRGGRIEKTAQRLPLAQTEQRLDQTVRDLIAVEDQDRGLRAWLRRKLQARLLGTLQTVTLARFRQADATGGGIDLEMIHKQLAAEVDALLGQKIQAALQSTTLLLIALAIVLSLGTAYAIRFLPI